MRIAIISDIHGNLVSFETVLKEINREKPDQIVCLGDVAAFGPQPREAIVRLKSLNCPVVMGNADEELLNPPSTEATDENARRIAKMATWGAAQLSQSDLDFIRTFRPTVQISLDGKTHLLCFHGSPKSNREIIRSTTPDEELEKILSDFYVSIMAGGHTHTQMIRRFREAIVMNPGSVGLPYERPRAKKEEILNPPWAEYAIINYEKEKLGIELRRVPVDIQAIRQAALQSTMPDAAEWAAGWR
ncbi:metallophosphoesterase family protein [Candidatus Acetothermia bacterium]|nr:metallophosphoesterase family protein [Candidatus Acetothermia bacterium]